MKSVVGISKNLFLIIEFYTEAGMGGRLRYSVEAHGCVSKQKQIFK
jgi:hypothetical protein